MERLLGGDWGGWGVGGKLRNSWSLQRREWEESRDGGRWEGRVKMGEREWGGREPESFIEDVSRFPTENIDFPTESGGFLQNSKIVVVSYRIRLPTENRIPRTDSCCYPYIPRRFAYSP